MIRNVCIHVTNEQPLLADLYDLPSASDAGLLCTNLRSMDGKRPIFIDSITATFFLPYHVIRFLEIPEGAVDPGAVRTRAPSAVADAPRPAGVAMAEAAPGSQLVVVLGAPVGDTGEPDPDADLEIDEDFLQRIRDI